MKKVSKHFRLSADVIGKIEDILAFYASISPIGRVTATDVVEEAVRLLHSKLLGGEQE